MGSRPVKQTWVHSSTRSMGSKAVLLHGIQKPVNDKPFKDINNFSREVVTHSTKCLRFVSPASQVNILVVINHRMYGKSVFVLLSLKKHL